MSDRIDLVRVHKGELELDQPRLVTGLGSDGVVVAGEIDFYGLSAHLEQLANAAANGDGPFPSARDPVRGDFRGRADRPSIAEMIVDDGIEEKLVGPVAAMGWAAERPDFVDPERRVRRRRIIKNRPCAPIETLAMLRRQKERRIAVGKPERPVLAEFL